MKRTYQIAGTILLVFSVLVVFGALQLRYYTTLGPGPGFFSFWLGIFLGLLAVIMVVQATFGASDPMPPDYFSDRSGYLRIAAVILSLVAATLLLERLGFLLTMLAVFLFLLRVLGRYGIVATVATAVIGSSAMFFVFEHLLNVHLPKGLLGL